MLDLRLHQPDGQQAQDLQDTRWEGLLRTPRMLDACKQSRWQLFQAYQQVDVHSFRLACVHFDRFKSCTLHVETFETHSHVSLFRANTSSEEETNKNKNITVVICNPDQSFRC